MTEITKKIRTTHKPCLTSAVNNKIFVKALQDKGIVIGSNEVVDISVLTVLSKRDVIKLFWNIVDNQWLEVIKEDRRLSYYLNFIGFHQSCHSPFVTPRRDEVMVNRLRLDACKLNAHLHKINLKDSPNCEICHLPETTEHLLFDCISNNELTEGLRQLCSSLGLTFSTATILSNIKTLKLITSYVKLNNISL